MTDESYTGNKPSPLSDDFHEKETKVDPRFGEITIFENSKTGAFVMQKEKISYKAENRDRDVFQALERMKLNHPNLLNMIGYSSYEHNDPENKFFRVRGYYEYIENDMMNEIGKRKVSGQKFRSRELKN